MSKLNAENLRLDVTQDGQIVCEPSYIQYLREHGYLIEEIADAREIDSDSSESGHIVYKIKTYSKPRDHTDFDAIADEITIPVCDCWSYRSNSVDVAETTGPNGTCKHCEKAFMTERAENDENQSTLFES